MKRKITIILIALVLAGSVHATGDKLNGWQLRQFLCNLGLVQYCIGKPTEHCKWKPCSGK